jgi:hypothetical protein
MAGADGRAAGPGIDAAFAWPATGAEHQKLPTPFFVPDPSRTAQLSQTASSARSGKKTVVFILSTSYSGSHYLSLMLGSHSQAMHLGEIHRIRQGANVKLEQLCFACRDRGFCPVLSAIQPDRVNQVYDIIFSRVDPGARVLVDASKLARGWAEQFLHEDRFERKYLHLIRDPRALVRRWMLKDESRLTDVRRRWKMASAFPRRSLAAVFADKADVLAYQWLRLNRRITRFIAANRLDARVLTYRDLAADPAGELRQLTEWLDLPHEPGQHEYWNFHHHGTQKRDYEWVKQQGVQHIDLRWQTDLPPAVQDRIATNRDVQSYLDEIGLRIGADGLRRAVVTGPVRQEERDLDRCEPPSKQDLAARGFDPPTSGL